MAAHSSAAPAYQGELAEPCNPLPQAFIFAALKLRNEAKLPACTPTKQPYARRSAPTPVSPESLYARPTHVVSRSGLHTGHLRSAYWHYSSCSFTCRQLPYPNLDIAALPCRCIICLFPAASVILSLAFTILYLVGLWVVTVRLAATVINR